jgi:serine/threonine protein kinase
MKYELIQELTPQTVMVRSEQGEDLVFDSLEFPIIPKETLRMELQKGLKEAIKQSGDIENSNLVKYQGLEKLNQGLFLVRKDFDRNGFLPFQALNSEQTIHALQKILEIMELYHKNEVVLGGFSLGQLKMDSKGEFYLQDPCSINYLRKSLTDEYSIDAPPEVISGKAWDRRADIFSWGVLAYRLLTGEDPFQAPTPAERLDKILKFGALSPKDVKPELSTQLSRLITRCMIGDPRKRPDLAELQSQLSCLVETGQIYATEDEIKEYQEKAKTNRRYYQLKERFWLWFRKFGVATTITVAVVVVILATWMGSKSKPLITEKNKPSEVVTFYFQGVQNLNVSLVDEAVYKAKNSFSDMVTNLFVINKTQQGMTYSTKDNIKLEFLGLQIQPLSSRIHQRKYQADYTLKITLAKETQYIERKEILVLQPIKKVWRITQIQVLKEKKRVEKNNNQGAPESPQGTIPPKVSENKKGS